MDFTNTEGHMLMIELVVADSPSPQLPPFKIVYIHRPSYKMVCVWAWTTLKIWPKAHHSYSNQKEKWTIQWAIDPLSHYLKVCLSPMRTLSTLLIIYTGIYIPRSYVSRAYITEHAKTDARFLLAIFGIVLLRPLDAQDILGFFLVVAHLVQLGMEHVWPLYSVCGNSLMAVSELSGFLEGDLTPCIIYEASLMLKKCLDKCTTFSWSYTN